MCTAMLTYFKYNSIIYLEHCSLVETAIVRHNYILTKSERVKIMVEKKVIAIAVISVIIIIAGIIALTQNNSSATVAPQNIQTSDNPYSNLRNNMEGLEDSSGPKKGPTVDLSSLFIGLIAIGTAGIAWSGYQATKKQPTGA